MSVENANLPPNSPSRAAHVLPILKSSEEVAKNPNRLNDDGSLHSYHLWLKEKQIRDNEAKKGVKMEDGDEESGEDHFQVDAVLERGPSPPESESSNAYEWSYEEQFKQVRIH